MNRRNQASDFERWLDRELPSTVAAELGPAKPPPPLVARPRRRRILRLGAPGAAAVLGVALAVAGGGAALATGSPNPVTWGRHVVQAVSVGSLAPQRSPVPAPESAPTPPEAPPSAPGGDGQQGAGAQGNERSSANAGNGKQQGHGDVSAPSDQNQQNPNRPAKLRGDRQGASQPQ